MADYRIVAFAVIVVCAAALQQLQVEPYPGEVGVPVTVTAAGTNGPIVGLAVAVELPDGSRREIGATDARGERAYLPEQPGPYVFTGVVAGVQLLAPHRVVAARRRYWLALCAVPLGLALIWQLSRARDRRGS